VTKPLTAEERRRIREMVEVGHMLPVIARFVIALERGETQGDVIGVPSSFPRRPPRVEQNNKHHLPHRGIVA
jgi:hypothetical protein